MAFRQAGDLGNLGDADRTVQVGIDPPERPRDPGIYAVPALQREAAQRNLDWFEFWLLGQEGLLRSKAEQYVRWRAAKARL